MQRDTVSGFIGALPFSLGDGGERRAATWSFDWSLASPMGTPGMGVRLLQSVIDHWGVLHTFGGNDNTRSLLPRIARYADADAAMTVMRPLRAGYWFDRARLRFPGVPVPPWFDRIPVPQRTASTTRIVPGISGEIAPLLDAELARTASGNPTRPAYELAYVDWLLGRCPEIETWTVLAGTNGPPGAAAALWRRRATPNPEWRVVLWQLPGDNAAARAVLDAAARRARAEGGNMLAAMVSFNDTERRDAFASSGFSPRRGNHPLYISARSADQPCLPISGLSLLDTDMAYIY